jgi:RNA polymerase sigma-70 factor, ECF subfamily
MDARTQRGLAGVVAGTDRWSDGTEAGAIERARAGDAEAFGALLQPRLERLYRLAYAITGNEPDARDATQEASLSAWRELPRLREVDRFDAWLDRVLVNACRMRLRKRRRVNEIRIDAMQDGERDRVEFRSPRGPDALAERDALQRAFDRLDGDDRTLLVLHHLQERPVNDIARVLGKPAGTVKWRLHRARAALERALAEEAR